MCARLHPVTRVCVRVHVGACVCVYLCVEECVMWVYCTVFYGRPDTDYYWACDALATARDGSVWNK